MNHRLTTIPNGTAGIIQTVKLMIKLARKYKTAPLIYSLSRKLTQDLPDKAYDMEVDRLYQFVQNRIRYVKDILNVETLQTPIQTLKIRSGDCDDKATLLASLCLSIGHPCRFVIVGHGGQFYHVYVEVKVGQRWIPADACEPLPLGQLKMYLPDKRVFHI